MSQDTLAAHFCRDCNKHFCGDCIYRHKNTDMFDEHVVKELSSRETTRTVCKEHEKELEPLRFFCQSCAVSPGPHVENEATITCTRLHFVEGSDPTTSTETCF